MRSAQRETHRQGGAYKVAMDNSGLDARYQITQFAEHRVAKPWLLDWKVKLERMDHNSRCLIFIYKRAIWREGHMDINP